MKTYSDERPRSLMPLGDGNYHYHYNIQEKESSNMNEKGEPHTQYVSDTVFITGEPTAWKILDAVVHETYTNEEIDMMKLLHQAAELGVGEEPDEYRDYLKLVVETRALATAAINEIAPQPETAAEQGEENTAEEAEEEIGTEEAECDEDNPCEESISPEDVGSVEDVLGDLIKKQ